MLSSKAMVKQGLGLERRRILRSLLATSIIAIVAMLSPGGAVAGSPIYQYEVSPTTTQAGGHPDLNTTIWVGNRYTQHIPPPSCDCQDPKNITVQLPTGVIGNPHATPKCSAADFAAQVCAPETQVGWANLSVNSEEPGSEGIGGSIAIFNLEPHPGQAGLIGLNVPAFKFPIFQEINARTESDYGLDITTVNINHFFPLAFIEEHIWGVPASPENDEHRFPAGWEPFSDGKAPPTPSNAQEIPFIDNPTTCGQEDLVANLTVLSYDKGVTQASTPYPATTGCDQLSFNPSLYAKPTTTATDTASGLDVDLQVPQQTSPEVPSPSEIRATTVALPEGFSINPNAADGKTSCSNAEASIGTRLEAHCPEDSKVGTLSVESSSLPGPIFGAVYLGTPLPGDRYRLILTADGYNVHVKLAGSAIANEQTGQVTVSFQDLPQTPFSDFNMHFFGSERGLLATPTECGTYGVKSTFTPWDSQLSEQTSTQFFTLESGPGGSGCPASPRPFQPSFHAGVADATAGAHSAFSLTLARPDGDQDLSALNVTTPPGFSATLSGVSYCPESTLAATATSVSGLSELSAPSCPASSWIGTATTAAGAGDHPVYLPGQVYLAGPYKSAPLSLAVVTPAVSGPYDLGNVVVRAALQVDPASARITAVSDPLPQIVGGIPLRLRQIQINLTRPEFALNPTNCDRSAVQASVFGDQGGKADLSVPFQVASCAGLPFGPKLSLKLSGGTTRAKNPALKATLTASPGEANIAQTAVTMPHSIFLDNSHINQPCTKPQLAAENCPAGSVMGTATAVTPLLEKPLQGTVYLAAGYGHKLPDVLVALKGQVDVNLDGIVTSVHQRLRTTFATVPDVPVTKFTLNLLGGKHGLLVNSANLCQGVQRATVGMTGQNNRRVNANPKLQLPCGKHGSGAKRKQHRRSAAPAGRGSK
jgi:hypothetical protein